METKGEYIISGKYRVTQNAYHEAQVRFRNELRTGEEFWKYARQIDRESKRKKRWTRLKRFFDRAFFSKIDERKEREHREKIERRTSLMQRYDGRVR